MTAPGSAAPVKPSATFARVQPPGALAWAIIDGMKPSERYRRDAELLLAFREAFIALVNDARSELDTLSSELVSGTDNETWQTKRRAVALAAGAAGLAYQVHGGIFTLRNAAYVMNGVSPVTNWEMSLRDPEQLPPETVIASVEAAAGSATRLAGDAAQRERGLTGLIAAFLRWPSNLREAVGYDRPAQARVAGAIGIAGQLVVGTTATAFGAAVVAGAARLWQVLT